MYKTFVYTFEIAKIQCTSHEPLVVQNKKTTFAIIIELHFLLVANIVYGFSKTNYN